MRCRYFTVDETSGASCPSQANHLNSVLLACSGSMGELDCADGLLLVPPTASSCDPAAEVLNAAIAEYSRRSERGRIICGGGGFLEFNDQDGSGSTCSSVANVLAAIIGEAFIDIAEHYPHRGGGAPRSSHAGRAVAIVLV